MLNIYPQQKILELIIKIIYKEVKFQLIKIKIIISKYFRQKRFIRA